MSDARSRSLRSRGRDRVYGQSEITFLGAKEAAMVSSLSSLDAQVVRMKLTFSSLSSLF